MSTKNLHGVGVHGLASVELVVLEVGHKGLLDVLRDIGLELLNVRLLSALFAELGLHGLQVA